MSQAQSQVHGRNIRSFRKGPHHVIIARGDKVRSFAIRPRSLIIGALLAILVVSGIISGGAYSFLKDDLVISSVAEQSRIRQDYELRIADLYRQMDAVVSRQLVEREALSGQVAELIERQGQLVERQRLLTGLASDALAAGIDVLPMLAPLPLANPLRENPPETNGIGGPLDPTVTGAVDPDKNVGIPQLDSLAIIVHTADWVEENQRDALATLAEAITERTGQLASALRSLGYAGATPGIGGPLVPAVGDADFEDVSTELAEFARMREFALSLPLARPLPRLDVSSGYGRRVDPFLGQSAMHTGVDLRAASGTIVHATAPGTVIAAGVSGGYGKMVEIDHGSGIVTAYAHLSSISVRVGQAIGAGNSVGRVGSTGRSTGPHLHYEIRKDDRSIDPMAHLLTGREIVGLL